MRRRIRAYTIASRDVKGYFHTRLLYAGIGLPRVRVVPRGLVVSAGVVTARAREA